MSEHLYLCRIEEMEKNKKKIIEMRKLVDIDDERDGN